MHISTKWIALATVMVVGAMRCDIVLAQDAAAAVEARQAAMKAQGKDTSTIKAFIDDKGDLAAAQAAGADLVARVAKIPTLFPQDTGMDKFPGKSWVKPVAWTERDKLVNIAKVAETKAAALETALKGGDKAAITAAFGDLGKNGCGACHEAFREKKPS
jgi:cytochrome c556